MYRLFRYTEEELPWREKEKIRHEINTFYAKYRGLPIIVHRSIGLDGKYYLYYVENWGFDNFNIFMRLPDLDEEDSDG